MWSRPFVPDRPDRCATLAQELWAAADEVFTASITYVETRAALAAGRRARFWTAPELLRLERAWEAAWATLHVVRVDPLIELAADLAAAEALRVFDAVHLAAAKVSACDVLVAADARLCAAASRQ